MTAACDSETSPLLPTHLHPPSSLSKLSPDSDLSSVSSSPISDVVSTRKYIALGAALINCLFAGSVLLFSLYAPLFQSKLGFTQLQVNAISVAAELGMYLPVPIFGYICDRHGPAVLSVMSSMFFGPAYVVAALAYSGHAGIGWMMVSFCSIGMGCSAMYFAGVTMVAKSFQGKGFALALPIASFGMSPLWQSLVVSHVFVADNELQVSSVFWFFAATLTIVGVGAAFGLNAVNLTVSEAHKTSEELDTADEVTSKDGWVNEETKKFLKDKTMWGLAAGIFLVAGPGEAFNNNMGSLIQTIQPAHTTAISTATQVSIMAFTSTAARLLGGALTDYLAPKTSTTPGRRFTVSRIVILTIIILFMASALLTVATGYIYSHPDFFWYVSAMMGAGYGATFTLAPTITNIVWGSENFGTNWGCVTVVPAVGATLFGSLWGAVYDHQARKDDSQMCWGRECSRLSFSLMTASVVAACGFWLWAWRCRGGWKARGALV